jgi:alpha-N-arabinofuranosidase
MRGILGKIASLLVAVGLAGFPVRVAGGKSPVTVSSDGQTPQARIKIDIDRTIGDVDPNLFGNFAEHLGRCIYGGIYEEGSPLSDKDGYRKDVMDATRQLGVTILRWPGGNFSSGYNWKDGIGPKDQRPVRADLAWGDIESNRFGTDEFLRYCKLMGLEPYICVNLGLGTIDDARNWVEYCNDSRHTYWADQRRKNGQDEPYEVKYWGLGNEIDGPWQLGHKNAEDYSKLALEAGKAMRAVDPSIKLIASGPSNYGADWIGWSRAALTTLRDQIDYISLHTYINNRDNDLEKFLGWSQTVDHYIEITDGQIREARSARPNARPIYIAYDEWNVWYRAFNHEHLEEVYNFEDALAMGMFFNSFFRHAGIVKMANLAQLVNVIAPMMTNKQGLFLQPIFFPIAEYGRQRGNKSIDTWVSGPTYKIGNRQPLGYLDVSATYNPSQNTVYLNVLNRSKATDISTRIENEEGHLEGRVGVWEMNNSDLKATHTFGEDKNVIPKTRTTSSDVSENALTYTFPAHSLTILRLTLRSQ